jgi:hypothetical protein
MTSLGDHASTHLSNMAFHLIAWRTMASYPSNCCCPTYAMCMFMSKDLVIDVLLARSVRGVLITWPNRGSFGKNFNAGSMQ